MRAASDVEDAIRALLTTGAPIVVALDGRSGAGKTTLAAALARRVDAAVVHVDHFYRDMAEEERASLSPRQGIDRYVDWQRLRAEALLPLWRGEAARFSIFDWDNGHGLCDEQVVAPRDVVLLEGTYSARPDFDDLVHLRVLVDTPPRARARRRRTLSRELPELVRRSRAAEREYFESVRPAHAFDMVVEGDDVDYTRTVRRVHGLVAGRLAGDIVAVVSRGDLSFNPEGSRLRHFPAGRDGGWIGHHPGSSEEATSALTSAREAGVSALIVPSPSRWWISHYVGFAHHLHAIANVAFEEPDGTLVFRFPALGGNDTPRGRGGGGRLD